MHGLELSPRCMFMTHAQSVTPVQNHEHTLIIWPKIVLSGLQVLLSSAGVADLSWACGKVNRPKNLREGILGSASKYFLLKKKYFKSKICFGSQLLKF